MTRRKKWLIGTSAGLLLLAVTTNAFDWNLARPYIARQVTRSTGRSFEIKGDLKVHLSLWPRVIANDIVMGNAAWGKDPTMARIKRVNFTISLPKLMIGRLSFPEISLSDFHLALDVHKDGTPNWVFGKAAKKRKFPHIDVLSIDNGTLVFRDPTSNTDLSFVINTGAVAEGGPDTMVEVKGKGKFRGMVAKLYASGGALLSLRRADRPYPIKAILTLDRTRASINGTLLDPLHLKKEKVNIILEGSDLAQLYPIIGVPFPPTPPYRLTGHLDHAGNIWTFRRFEGIVGKSDLTGDLSVDLNKAPQLVTADLKSRSLEMKDLSGFIGAGLVSGPRNKVLPTMPFSLEKIRAADVDVLFKGEKILAKRLSIEEMDAHLIIKDGMLKLAPLNFKIAGGNLVTEITMDGRGSHIVTHADITAKGLHLDQLFLTSKLTASNPGVIGGRAKLDAKGDSISQMMGTANGEAALIMDGGTISELVLRKSNVDIANSFLVLVRGDKSVPIRCMVANFKAVEGNFKVQDLVLDTPKVNIAGDGNVNFADESLHLRLVSQSKSFSLISLRGPILITGTLMQPKAMPDTTKLAARGGAAVGLAAVTVGAAGLIPLLDFGNAQDSNCAALMDRAKSDAGIKQSDFAP
ncbi:MAG: AsmA family protein [Nitrospirae bacterium]|nr:AsmA family protein [Nitrospirota bacterium]NTW65190.1 AsmA family protein [Nitrospirota bacterium]